MLFFLFLQLYVRAALCRTMYVQSLTLEGCFHIQCSKCTFSLSSLIILFEEAGLRAWFGTSQMALKPILVQYSAYTSVLDQASAHTLRMDLCQAVCKLLLLWYCCWFVYIHSHNCFQQSSNPEKCDSVIWWSVTTLGIRKLGNRTKLYGNKTLKHYLVVNLYVSQYWWVQWFVSKNYCLDYWSCVCPCV